MTTKLSHAERRRLAKHSKEQRRRNPFPFFTKVKTWQKRSSSSACSSQPSYVSSSTPTTPENK